MKEEKDPFTWKPAYTVVIIFNVVLLTFFYFFMQKYVR